MGGILENAGIGGFLENRHSDRPDQDDHDEWTTVCQKWSEMFGSQPVSASQLLQVLLQVNPESDLANPDTSPRQAAAKAGYKLRARSGKVYGEFKIQRSTTSPTSKSAMYRVVKVG